MGVPGSESTGVRCADHHGEPRKADAALSRASATAAARMTAACPELAAALINAAADGASADSDAALLARIAQGSEPAMEQLYGRHSARVFRFALARLDDPLAADDVMNETMLQVWAKARHYRGESSVSTWIMGIAHCRAMDCLRDRYRHHGEAPSADLPDEATPDVAVALAGAQDADRVRAAMRRLSDEHRAVLHLAFFEDLGYERIAAILGCPVGTVKSRVYHAKQLLKHYLAD